jgi:hypothetical protein
LPHNADLPSGVYRKPGRRGLYDKLGNAIAVLPSTGEVVGALPLLQAQSILRRAVSAEDFCGVYFLIADGAIVYVGRSIKMASRIQAHRAAGVRFDSFYCLRMPVELVERAEAAYIARFAPPLNRARPRRHTDDVPRKPSVGATGTTRRRRTVDEIIDAAMARRKRAG